MNLYLHGFAFIGIGGLIMSVATLWQRVYKLEHALWVESLIRQGKDQS